MFRVRVKVSHIKLGFLAGVLELVLWLGVMVRDTDLVRI